MKRAIVAIVVTALVTIVCWYATGTLRRGEVSSATPSLGSLEAVAIASRLEVGMSERRVQRLLKRQLAICSRPDSIQPNRVAVIALRTKSPASGIDPLRPPD